MRVFLTTGIFVAAIAGIAATAQTPHAGPADAARNLIEGRCTGCHATDQVYAVKMPADEWKATIDRMIDYGAAVEPAERERIEDYLVSHNAP